MKKQTLAESLGRLSQTLEKEGFAGLGGLQPGKSYLLFDAREKRPVLRWLAWISAVPPLVTLLLVTRVSEVQLLLDFGQLWAGRLFQAALVIVSGVFIYVLHWLSGKYVLQIRYAPDKIFVISCWSLYGATRMYHWQAGTFSSGVKSRVGITRLPGKPLVNAPYFVWRTDGKKFVIDCQASFPHGEDLLMEAIGIE
ncbi:hypothetical protein [Sediminibacterium ginsengisoli]|uniref:Uncharacterized protein n=1 Tax=Sediminibacterium ginsengisoli TaxID=413434 RepID=A0A1T4R2T9_9BACT|nr:hypothetical protein [Sediminibacterium ginsengisoli]SKA09918.1 hypothetical protein SAMN04488132_11067 [Sediminibacterium ginsengisoli]